MSQLFDATPADLRGGATTFTSWEQLIRNGDLDDRIGKIEGFLAGSEVLARVKPRPSVKQTLAAESAPAFGGRHLGNRTR